MGKRFSRSKEKESTAEFCLAQSLVTTDALTADICCRGRVICLVGEFGKVMSKAARHGIPVV